jgi:hypothetical protein
MNTQKTLKITAVTVNINLCVHNFINKTHALIGIQITVQQFYYFPRVKHNFDGCMFEDNYQLGTGVP